jgi:two-component system, LuxR family, sensor kinase FixL
MLRMQGMTLNAMNDGVALVDRDGRIEFANPAFNRMFGGAPRELAAVMKLLHSIPNGQVRGRAAAKSLDRHAGRRTRREILLSRADGPPFACAVSLLDMDLAGEDKILLMVQDVSERRRLEAEILELGDHERRRLSADLHDGLGQQLAGISLMLRSLAMRADSARRRDPSELDEIIGLVNHAIQSVRNLALGISPLTLRRGELVPALKRSTAWFRDNYGVDVRLHLMIHRSLLVNESAGTHLYLIAQEAINNAIRHGHARSVIVKLRTSTNLVYLSITDDGVGLAGGPSRRAGLGLKIMEYRAAVIGGAMHIKRLRHGGTRVRIICPRISADAGPSL